MRKIIGCSAVLLGLMSSSAVAQETTATSAFERLKRSTSETLAAAGELTAQKRAEAEKRFEKELKDLDISIADLKSRARDAGAEATAKAASYLPDLEKRKRDLEGRLEDLKTRSGYAWDDMATGTERALDELKKSYEKAKSRFE